MKDIAETELCEFEAILLQLFKLEQTIHWGLTERAKLEQQLEHFLPMIRKVEQERRGHLRALCSIRADIMCDQGFASGRVLDLSLGGLFIETDLKLLVNDKVEMELLPEDEPGIAVKGKVVWRKSSTASGVGVMFEGNSPKQEDMLLELMVDIMKRLFITSRQEKPQDPEF